MHACPACVRSSCRLGPAQPSEFWKDSERCGCESRRHRCFRIATFSQWLSRCLRTKNHRHRTELHILTFSPKLFSARCSLERQRWLLRHSTADTKRELGAHKPQSFVLHTLAWVGHLAPTYNARWARKRAQFKLGKQDQNGIAFRSARKEINRLLEKRSHFGIGIRARFGIAFFNARDQILHARVPQLRAKIKPMPRVA